MTDALQRGRLCWLAVTKLLLGSSVSGGFKIMMKFCNSVFLINYNFVSPVWFSKQNTFATLVSCLSTYIAASPRLVVTVFKTLSTWQEQLNMKVMVSRGTVCKKKVRQNYNQYHYHYKYALNLLFRAFSPWLWPSFSSQRSMMQNNLGQVLQLTSEDGKPDPSTILAIADDLCFRSLAPLPQSLTPSVPP